MAGLSDLGKLARGAGPKSTSGWVRLAVFVALLVITWVLAWDMGLFLVLVVFGGWTAYSWFKDKANVVDSFRDFVLYSALLATAMRGPMTGMADGFRSAGPVIKDTVVQRWNDARSTAPQIAITPAAPVTTVPPAASPPAVVQAAATR